MIVYPFYTFFKVRQSLKRRARPGGLLAPSRRFWMKKKLKTPLNIHVDGSFEHTHCADANGYVQDDAVLEFLTKDYVQRSMGKRKHQKRHHEVVNQPASPVNKKLEKAERKQFVHQCEMYLSWFCACLIGMWK